MNSQIELIKQIKDSFSSVYLTLISIIQGGVIGYLIFIIGSRDIKYIEYPMLFIAFLIIILTWHEYVMGSTTFRWVPDIIDSIIPFILGISELLVIHYITAIIEYTYIWLYMLAVFCFVGLLAYINMYFKAKKHIENKFIFDLLGKYPLITKLWISLYVFIFILLGFFSKQYSNSSLIQWIIVIFAGLLMLSFGARGFLYWRKIINP